VIVANQKSLERNLEIPGYLNHRGALRVLPLPDDGRQYMSVSLGPLRMAKLCGAMASCGADRVPDTFGCKSNLVPLVTADDPWLF